MQIHQEEKNEHTILAYSDLEVRVGDRVYHENLILCKQSIICPWSAHSIKHLTEEDVKPLLELDPEVILIGHSASFTRPPNAFMTHTSKQRIGLECMSIGAACRTFNVLLSEQRKVVIGLIFNA